MHHQYIIIVRGPLIQKIVEISRYEKERTLATLVGKHIRLPADLKKSLLENIKDERCSIWRISSDLDLNAIEKQSADYPYEFLNEVTNSGVQLFAS